MSAELTVLGAGSILPRDGYGCSGYALRPAPGEPVTLLDCGPGSVRMLGRVGIELGDVRRVVLSHFHLDHCLDLFALAFARRNPRFAPPPELDVRGPVGLKRLVDEAPRSMGHWASDPAACVTEVELDLEQRGGFAAGGLRFDCVHTGHNAEAVAWRVELPDGATLAYTGDTGPNPAVAELARGVDLFVVECSFADAEATPNHLSPSGAGEMAARAGARRLLLTHFYPGLEPEDARAAASGIYEGPIELARDGSVHPIASRPRMEA